MPQYGHESGRQDGGGYSVTALKHEIDTGNSTTSLLGSGGVFTGAAKDIDGYASVTITIHSDQNGAVDGLKFQWSHDLVEWDTSDEYTYSAGSYKIYSIQPHERYFRVVYTNGSVAQGSFHMTAQLHMVPPKPSSHRLKDDLSQEDDCELVKAVIAAELPNNAVSNVGASAGGSLKVVITEENQDAFGRVRTSEPVVLMDSTFGYNLNPRIFEDISSGNGTVTYDSDHRAAHLEITAGAPGVAGLQTYQYAHYNPGKSHQIFITEAADPNSNGFAAGQKYEVGYFDDENGVFARRDSTGVYVVRRSKVSGSVVDTTVSQENFNIDPLDGTGPSGVILDPSNSQIIVIDLQFLGVGRVRIGVVVSGKAYYAHEFNFANEESGMYMQTATLPVRWVLTDTGTTGYDHAEAYCMMVSSEGGMEQNRGIPFAQPSASTSIASGSDTYIMSIRPKTTFNSIANRIWNILKGATVANTGNSTVLVKVWYDSTVGGTPNWADVDTSDSGMEWEDGSGTWSAGSGILIDAFSVSAAAAQEGAGETEITSRLPIALNKAGTSQVGMISITAQGLGGTSTAVGTVKWREIR
jgi:hypothetical protein